MRYALLSPEEANAARWHALGLDFPVQPPVDGRGRTAHHEAGHAVAHYLLGGAVARIVVTPHARMEPAAAALTDNVDAAISGLRTRDLEGRERQLLHWLHQLLAGPAAEALLDRRTDWDGEKDREAMACARELYTRELGDVPVSWHFTQTLRVLAHHRVWGAVRGLAEQLAMTPELTGDRIHGVLDAAIQDLRGRWVPRAFGDGQEDRTWLD